MKTLILTVLCALFSLPALAADRGAESAYDRVMRTGVIRCGYVVYGSFFAYDPNTGKMSGIFYDIMEQIGKNAGLKVEWTEEVGFGDIFAGLDAGRFDVYAGGLWPSTERAKAGHFTTPAFYSIITAWARADETRFQNLDGINDPSVRISAVDGALESIIARTDYPEAELVSLPQITPYSMNFQNITDNKAYITFGEPSIVHDFLKAHPGALKEIAADQPLRIFGNSLVVKKGELELKEFLDSAMQEVVFSGQADRILKTYEDAPA